MSFTTAQFPSDTIAGAPVETTESFAVIDPATAEPFAQAPSVTADQVDRAVRAADAAFGSWRHDDSARRAALHAAADAVDAAAGEIAPILTAEQGNRSGTHPSNCSSSAPGCATTPISAHPGDCTAHDELTHHLTPRTRQVHGCHRRSLPLRPRPALGC